MTSHAAWAKCRDMFGHLGTPFTRTRRKSVADRFIVGYRGKWPNNYDVIMGAGPSWEIAFERATRSEP